MTKNNYHQSPLLKLPNTFRAFYGAFAGLHRVQSQAIDPILNGEDMIIQSATGTGKSEAVLAPCLEQVILSHGKRSVLYIIPTKALAMDLKRRFESIIKERLELKLAIRTGDYKNSLTTIPDIMLTTPESLDVMLGSSNTDIKGFLAHIKTVIIDEVHQLVHQYRGCHLAFLFSRLERRTGCKLQKIAMSATIAHKDQIIDCFEFDQLSQHIIDSVERKIIARLIHIRNEERELPALINDLYETWHYKKILIFANSRGTCDRVFSILSQTGAFKGSSLLHYSNLKPLERKEAEKRFRKDPHALCIATSTLELGIDVGDVDAVLLYEPPGSVSSFLQRAGRSNRRKNKINVWGVCRGECARTQVIRFLALLELSSKGKVETPIQKTLPSVLSQQIISCLYEKKQLSVKSMESLFPEHSNILSNIFSSLEKKRWLSALNIPGLFKGGWQYREHLFEYKIWGNFPEIQKEYILEVSDKPIADIPKSIVGQMDVGDTVFIAGKRLEILKIDHSEHKKVLAKPGTRKDEKQLAWIGMGALVSFEVAQAMKDILKTQRIKNSQVENSDCLFKRTKKLVNNSLDSYKNRVVLQNKIEVISSPNASYQYLTFIGAMGNLILEWAIREKVLDDDLLIISNETGIECSLRIKFEELNLPVNLESLQAWVKKHFKILSSIFTLNLFCKTLPKTLIIQELTDFLYDPRVMDFFQYCLTHTSESISGDIADIMNSGHAIQETQEPELIDIIPGSPVLQQLKHKVTGLPAETTYHETHKELQHKELKNFLPALHAFQKKEYTLTATMISDYFFHEQCKKRFAFKFLQLDPPLLDNAALTKNQLDKKLKIQIMKKGVRHEAQVLDNLKKQSQNIIFLKNTGSLDSRFKAFLKTLKIVIQKLMVSNSDTKNPVFLSQCVLKDTVLNHGRVTISPLGIPDLLVLSKTRSHSNKNENKNIKTRIIIEAGDIKSSLSPRYHHKWQVAFYALLLKNIIELHKLPIELADTGFLLTQSHDSLYKRDRFDLKPYLTAFPIMFETIFAIIADSEPEIMGRLQPHCISCDLFSLCYQNALKYEDIQFLPGLSQGELLKLRQMGCNTIRKTCKTLENISPSFDMISPAGNQAVDHASNQTEHHERDQSLSSEQAVKLLGQCRAFIGNRIYINKKKTRLYPHNISYAIIIQAVKNPISGLLSAFGWETVDRHFSKIRSQIYLIDNQQNSEKVWNKFSTELSNTWQAGIQKNRVPHLFYFGSKTRNAILEWGKYHQKEELDFLWQTQPDPWTDLRKVYMNHFYMPVPGIVSLHTLAHIFECGTATHKPETDQSEADQSKVDQPKTLFHQSWQNSVSSTDVESMIQTSLAIMIDLYKKADHYLESQWIQECELIQNQNRGELSLYLRFINEEQRLQEDNILTLQELSLQERIAQFRAIGHLRFTQTRLDEEGRFLYVLKSSAPIISKFRKGDFLRLTPHGIENLQEGFPIILVKYDIKTLEISVRARSKKMHLNKQFLYSLEEDISQWNQAKLTHVAKFCFSKDMHPLQNFLAGQATGRQPDESISWVKHWLASQKIITKADHSLNDSQLNALLLPFKYKNSMIQGPPGTGKTHLLGWILIALIMQAKKSNKPICIGVTALTHQAINNVLEKVVTLANQYMPSNFTCRCIKWGESERSEQPDWTHDENSVNDSTKLEFSNIADEILSSPLVIVGATGYGFYNLFNSKNNNFPQALDWMIFDEASQVPMPQALLSLIYSKGNFLFLGDVNQLPPIVHGKYEEQKNHKTLKLEKSILANFQDIYPQTLQASLNISYRMNKRICEFPSKTWYKNKLYPAQDIARNRLCLIKPEKLTSTPLELEYDTILNPAKPVVLVLTDTQGCTTRSEPEAQLMAGLAHRLITAYKIKAEQIAIISPHRAQNNEITQRLGILLAKDHNSEALNLPLIDTIERIQGAQRDIIIFGLTSSDSDHISTDFLNNSNRLNVAITRAKTKLIISGSKAFFHVIPDSENMLAKNHCFKALHEHCKKSNSIYEII
jgi:Lhr-like helicase